MVTSRDADRALGVELQLEELVEQRRRAEVQHRFTDVDRLDREVEQLQNELALTADPTVQADLDAPPGDLR